MTPRAPKRRNKEEDDCGYNQNEYIPTNPAGFSPTTSKSKCESVTPYEIKHIEWEVKNISRAITVAKIAHPYSNNVEIDAIRFTAGESIDMSSEWKLVLETGKRPATTTNTNTTETGETPPPPSGEGFGLYLHLSDYKGNSNSVFAEYTVSLKLPNGSIYLSSECSMEDWKVGSNWGWKYITSTTCQELKKSNVIQDDAFTIYVDLTICLKNRMLTSSTVENEKLMKVAGEEFKRQFEMLLEDGTCSDFTIKVPKLGGEGDGYENFQVHRVILAARSSIFKAMFEAQMQETKTGEVVITDVSPLAMKILLKFIYTGILEDEWILAPEEVILAADKYHLATMKDMCEENFAQVLTPSNALNLMQLTKILNLQKASKSVIDYVKSNMSDIYDKA